MSHENDEAAFQGLIAKARVPVRISDALLLEGYTTAALFSFAFPESELLERYLEGLLQDDFEGDLWRTSVEASSVRYLHHLAKACPEPAQNKAGPNTSSQPIDYNLLSLAWADLPPQKVADAEVIRLKQEFASKYPSEVLHPGNTPSTRYLSTILQQKARSAFSWLPWKEITSEAKVLELADRGKKRQKIEGVLFFDVVQECDDQDLSGAPWFIQQLLETRRNALSLANLCHLSVLRKLDVEFMRLYTQRCADGLRPANAKEAQSADKEFWVQVFRLVNEHAWSFENAILEVLEARNFLQVLLMPRAKSFQAQPPTTKGKGKYGQRPKGTGKSKGKSKPHGSNFDQSWPSNWERSCQDQSGSEVRFCFRFHSSGSCALGSMCKFSHACPVNLGSGKGPCLKHHAAKDHGGSGKN